MQNPYTDEEMETIRKCAEFLLGAYEYAKINLNPELGFLNKKGKSAFANVTEDWAQKAQIDLEFVNKTLRNFDIDPWEICMKACIYWTHRGFAMFSRKETKDPMFRLKYIQQMDEYWNDGSFNVVKGLKGESDERKKSRRNHFIMQEIQNIHKCHPMLDNQIISPPSGVTALVIIEQLLPPLWADEIKRILDELGGTSNQFESEPEKVKENVEGFLEDYYMTEFDESEWNDDPTEGLW